MTNNGLKNDVEVITKKNKNKIIKIKRMKIILWSIIYDILMHINIKINKIEEKMENNL